MRDEFKTPEITDYLLEDGTVDKEAFIKAFYDKFYKLVGHVHSVEAENEEMGEQLGYW